MRRAHVFEMKSFTLGAVAPSERAHGGREARSETYPNNNRTVSARGQPRTDVLPKARSSISSYSFSCSMYGSVPSSAPRLA